MPLQYEFENEFGLITISIRNGMTKLSFGVSRKELSDLYAQTIDGSNSMDSANTPPSKPHNSELYIEVKHDYVLINISHTGCLKAYDIDVEITINRKDWDTMIKDIYQRTNQ